MLAIHNPQNMTSEIEAQLSDMTSPFPHLALHAGSVVSGPSTKSLPPFQKTGNSYIGQTGFSLTSHYFIQLACMPRVRNRYIDQNPPSLYLRRIYKVNRDDFMVPRVLFEQKAQPHVNAY